MALVDYSDSEGSDTEGQAAPVAPSRLSTTKKPSPFASSKPAFAKPKARPSEPRKIQVNLPAAQVAEESEQPADEPAAKRARTSGAFSGFNSLLPAPKKLAGQNAPRAGINLKTSSEAAFSRASETLGQEREERPGSQTSGQNGGSHGPDVSAQADEVKVVGKATKFKPLSVANSKRKAPLKKVQVQDGRSNGNEAPSPTPIAIQNAPAAAQSVPASQPPRPKRSLFSVSQDDTSLPVGTPTRSYESLTTRSQVPAEDEHAEEPGAQYASTNTTTNPPSLQSLTSDLNLTPAQRRQLFGRHGKVANINIAHFDMDAEYASNEQMRQAGEVVEHRAVKSIAPGKHSLQQLVNNARSQQDAMEDKWAEGRRERGEGGSKYGWTR